MRRRARQFDPELKDFRRAIHWLWKRGVSRQLIGELFGKSTNQVSVSAYDENLAEHERRGTVDLPPEPNLKIAEDDLILDLPPVSTLEIAEEVETASKDFWGSVRSLEGIPVYGKLLQRLSKRSEEDILAHRLRARLKKMTAETYAHAGYLESAIALASEALNLDLKLYNDTRSKVELLSYAKVALLISLSHIQREEWRSALGTLKRAEQAFQAADVPIDPEVYRQRASIRFQQGRDDEAKILFKMAYDAFPAHRELLGFGEGAHARHDVGKRPLAYMTGDFGLALQNLEFARAWPEGDIHHAINLNAAIATAFLSDTKEAGEFINDNLTRAVQESAGFGHQSTIIHLLELTPRIPLEHRTAWVRFALNYNAYRNR